ncbi:hypothetical protein AL755_06940 [Arthrobacter sp. ERGS1:01]|uniref:hypothetical protein n=1 Tax=Arthrobacter sp. ERGS1:01 TaxID=1704044 RepID=UPI0006B686E5|nr:hypothetical protein [Arthrobacter sp. ERGS1:01]ALE05270.1 hypothetical protein AL755_06940 [Arthrobacter sp. ERGS1:01]
MLLNQAGHKCVGSDILLARHGSAIDSMRLDRGRGRVVAVLADGTTDSAPNLIDPALEMPGRFSDRHILGVIGAATLGVTAVMVAAAWIFTSLASPAQLADLSNLATAMGNYYPAM